MSLGIHGASESRKKEKRVNEGIVLEYRVLCSKDMEGEKCVYDVEAMCIHGR